MDTTTTYDLILDAALVGQCLLVISQLLMAGFDKPWRLPLLLVFVAAMWAGFASIFMSLAIPIFFATSGISAAFLAIGSLWIYTVMMTAPSDDLSMKPYLKHLWPVPLALLALLPLVALPDNMAADLLRTGDVDSKQKFRAVLPWVLLQFLWVLWTPPYLYSIWKRLTDYRIELRNIHSSTEQREFLWISALVGVLVLFWIANLLDLFDLFGPDLSLPNPVVFVIEALVVWIPALWGLRAQPGMRDENKILDASRSTPITEKKQAGKYERSALDEERSQRIVRKLETALQTNKLHLNANLSLSMLATETGVSTHYLSQVFNDTLGMSFFEYVNRQRTKDAAELLRNSSLPAIEVSVQSGFNSRSSFYNAFKKHYGCSPAAYRKNTKG